MFDCRQSRLEPRRSFSNRCCARSNCPPPKAPPTSCRTCKSCSRRRRRRWNARGSCRFRPSSLSYDQCRALGVRGSVARGAERLVRVCERDPETPRGTFRLPSSYKVSPQTPNPEPQPLWDRSESRFWTSSSRFRPFPHCSCYPAANSPTKVFVE